MQIAHSLIAKSATYAIAVQIAVHAKYCSANLQSTGKQICKASKCARKFATLASKLGKVGEGVRAHIGRTVYPAVDPVGL